MACFHAGVLWVLFKTTLENNGGVVMDGMGWAGAGKWEMGNVTHDLIEMEISLWMDGWIWVFCCSFSFLSFFQCNP